MTEIKNCMTCAHCQISSTSAAYDHCILCGNYCSIIREYPTHLCDKNLSGWVPRTFNLFLLDNKVSIIIIISLLFIILFSNISH